MMTIANPIYDSVFKFLMEDERVAKTILSALLKKNIVKVEVRPHEYSNSQRDSLSMFRIDFAATVREDDGHEHIILIEVQKTWLETETLRFRQYLGVQYQRKENIMPDSKEGYALPMVAVYILGHKVGDIEEPVIYVHHDAYDYNDKRVTKGLPNPFVDSLTHDSIIVQIPRLHGQVNNRLDKVLSVFDQTLHLSDSEHFLNFDESRYLGDEDMQPILHRLLMAASDADTRQDMNVEDEYYSIIEKRDTQIMLNARKIAEQNVQLTEQKAQLTEQKAQLTEQKAQLTEQKAQLAHKDEVIRNSVLALARTGMSEKEIADSLLMNVEAVRAIISNL
ncbi:MAG: hypothetical protein IJ804_10790 [Prevotella sp.]|nr:hypothetical protein [Prevotella sp.]